MKKVSEKLAYCENSQYLCGVKKRIPFYKKGSIVLDVWIVPKI